MLNFNFNYNISDPVKKNNITIFFLQSKTKLENNFLTLEESISKSLVDIKEINSKGTIRYLKVSNKSNQKLLILGSEQIIGNALKQNRVVNNTTLVPEQTTILLSVSCCEKNRWSPAVANNICTSESLYFTKGRINNSVDIFDNNKTDQFKIWDDIAEKLDEFNTKSFTGTLEDTYNKNKLYFDEITKYFKINENDVGVVAAIGNRLVNVEIFSSNKLLKMYFPKIIKSLIFESYKKTSQNYLLGLKDVYKLFRLIEFSEKKLHKPHNDCLGEEIRFNSDRVVGSCLNYKEKLLHFSGFLKDDMNVPLFKSKVA
jgi:hypothetical protein|tara:strand:+ start:120 stop:1061 length:942 start_codon:yes stop_codon:yes gene_type:complete